MALIRKADDHDLADAAHVDLELVPGESHNSIADEQEEQRKLLRASKIAKTMTVVLTLSLLILWPMPMYGAGYIFSLKFFTGWVVVGIMWLFGALFTVSLFALWQGRKDIFEIAKSVYLDISGKRHPSTYHNPTAIYVEGKDTGSDTPPTGNEKEIAEKSVVSSE